MASEEKIEKRSHIIGFKEEIKKAAKKSKDDFFIWFNLSKDTEESFIRGSWDFLCHIALPIISYLKEPEKKTVLEIGHGGARILAAASRFFKNAIGVDIHHQNKIVLEELNRRGIKNIRLYQTDGKSIPIKDNSVDVVFSFIVLQHVEKISIFKKYFQETYRILKPQGMAILYFGREYKYSFNRSSKALLYLDMLIERIKLKKGYVEFSAPVNHTNLKVSMSYAKKISKKMGFEIKKTLVSKRRAPDGMNLFGGQNGLVLMKQMKEK